MSGEPKMLEPLRSALADAGRSGEWVSSTRPRTVEDDLRDELSAAKAAAKLSDKHWDALYSIAVAAEQRATLDYRTLRAERSAALARAEAAEKALPATRRNLVEEMRRQDARIAALEEGLREAQSALGEALMYLADDHVSAVVDRAHDKTSALLSPEPPAVKEAK